MAHFRELLRHNTSWRRLAISALVAAAAALLWIAAAVAAPPRAIELVSFEAASTADGIAINWVTATELNTAGFQLKRAQGLSTPAPADFQIITFIYEGAETTFVTASGGVLTTEYDALDPDVTTGTTYWYILVEIETSGGETDHGPISVAYGATPTPTATQPVNTATPSRTPTVTPGSTPASTATNTPTPASTVTTTPGASSTPAPTNTQQETSVPTVTTQSSGGGSATVTVVGQPIAQITASPVAYPGQESSGAANTSQPLQATPAGAYPGPESAYPAPGSAVDAIDFTPTAYPVQASEANDVDNGAADEGTGAATTIGENSAVPVDDSASASAGRTSTSNRNTILMWIGFIASLLIFGGGLTGAIFLFNRQRGGAAS